MRPWQKRFLLKYHENPSPNFLCVACPGAGKTMAAGQVVSDLLAKGVVQRVLIVVPSEGLRSQWQQALAKLGVVVDPSTMNGNGREKKTLDGKPCNGWVVTYHSLFHGPATHEHRNREVPTLVVLDEVHHLGVNT